jgi:hypothetical protein
MGVIYNTVLATSQPLTICTGFPMFPPDSGPYTPEDTRTGIDYDVVLVDVDNTIPLIDLVIVGVDFKIVFKIEFEIFIGFCGPAIALGCTVQGETYDDGTAVGQFFDDQAQAGFALGAAMGFTLDFEIGLEIWYDVLVASGSFLIFGISFSLNINIDILGTIIGLLAKAVEESDTQVAIENIDPVPPGFWPGSLEGQVYGMYDESDGAEKALNQGQLMLEPSITVQIDISPYIPYIRQLKELVETVGGELASGPEITLSFPITINVDQLIADGQVYTLQGTLSDSSGLYQQQLAIAAIEAYNAKGWYIPQLPDLLSLAARTVLLGVYPDTTNYFVSLINGAGGTVPDPPPSDANQNGNTLGFGGGPTPAGQVITDVKVQFTHQVGITVAIGWFFHIEILGLTVDAAIDIPIDLSAVFGPLLPLVKDQLENTNGARYVGARDDLRVAAGALDDARSRFDRQFVDVVFEPVA